MDTIARKVAQELSEQMGQQFVVENKPGASGTMGAREVARAEPDGYTLLAIDNSYTMLPYVFAKLPWDHASDLVPITVSAFSPIMVVVGEGSRFADLKGLIDHARQNPEQLTYGTGGKGSATHFAAEAFQQAADVKLYHVPYKGAGDAVVGVMSGQVDLITASPPSVMGNIRGGQMRWRSAGPIACRRCRTCPPSPRPACRSTACSTGRGWRPEGHAARDHPKAAGRRRQGPGRTRRQGVPRLPRCRTGRDDPEAFARLMQEETERWREVAAKAGFEAK